MTIKEMQNKFGPYCIGIIVRLISDTEIIAYADTSNLHIDDNIQIYHHGEDIITPDGDNLGAYNKVKDTLQITQIEPKYIIAKKTKRDSDFLQTFATSPLLVTHSVPMHIDQDEIHPLSPVDMNIHVGDPIKLA